MPNSPLNELNETQSVGIIIDILKVKEPTMEPHVTDRLAEYERVAPVEEQDELDVGEEKCGITEIWSRVSEIGYEVDRLRGDINAALYQFDGEPLNMSALVMHLQRTEESIGDLQSMRSELDDMVDELTGGRSADELDDEAYMP